MTDDFKELRGALDAYEKWLADGAPVVDPDDTYPDDLYLAATRPAPIRYLLAELDAARKDAERWRTFIGLGYEVRAEWAANLSLAPILTSWVDAAMKEQQP